MFFIKIWPSGTPLAKKRLRNDSNLFMSKKAILVHGWEGDPENNWFPWLKKELINRGYEVVAPQLPDSDHPKMEPWLKTLTEAASEVDEQTVFIGHSVGCQTIFRFLENAPEQTKINKVICVAGWFLLFDEALETEEEKEMAAPWLTKPIDFAKVKAKVKKIIAIFSDNDQYVPFEENKKFFQNNLKAEVYLVPGQWHFDDVHNIKELPRILDFVD